MNNIASLIVIVTGLGIAPALAAGQASDTESAIPGIKSYSAAAQGADLAQMWCSACHVTDTGAGQSAMDSAPPFSTLAPLVAASPEHYRTFLTMPHGPMKEITLSRDEIEAVIAYISSLAKQQPAAR